MKVLMPEIQYSEVELCFFSRISRFYKIIQTDQASKSEFLGQLSCAESSLFVSLMWDHSTHHLQRHERDQGSEKASDPSTSCPLTAVQSE